MKFQNLDAAYLVWRIADAPEALKALACRYPPEADEDDVSHGLEPAWLAVMPATANHDPDPSWMWYCQYCISVWSKVEATQHPAPRQSLLDDKTIIIWDYSKAPEEYTRLFHNGNHEDWLSFVPAPLANVYIGWMEDGTHYGRCEVIDKPVPDGNGAVLRVGVHS